MSQLEDPSNDKVASDEAESSKFAFINVEESIKKETVEEHIEDVYNEEEKQDVICESSQDSLINPLPGQSIEFPITEFPEDNFYYKPQETNNRTKRRVNFSKMELDRLKRLVLKFPVIERKQHDKKSETMKKECWRKIVMEFNSHEDIIKRNVDQLKGAWKRIKSMWKNKRAAQRRCKFKSEPFTLEHENKMLELLKDQMPSKSIPKDNSETIYNPVRKVETNSAPVIPIVNISPVPTSSLTKVLTAPREAGPVLEKKVVKDIDYLEGKLPKKAVSLEQELHNAKMAFMKAEHLKRMEVLNEEMRFWSKMNLNAEAYGSSLRSLQIPLPGIPVHKVNGNVF
ncbi:uncharacterized protein LOC129001483 isoform X1 [Macrosteles quadrilineatus]|uniref:uncharacterized protein LOC129001483 isoform X1 n=1 Tax=Macrosteles quadrilineatus TaxID=74068 RepID=UPI0023E22591|nr:uncharacterized protein LOC129001483 isoform X1 [Macrosteles quadrilineatus]